MTTTYTKLRDGEWGVRGDAPLTAGATVTVTRQDGSTRTEIIDRVLFTRRDGVAVASIKPARRPDSRSGGGETQTCWECGRRFTRAQARVNGGDWIERYCGC